MIDVSEQTLKVGANQEEVLYFGFAEGDQIVFNFEEVDGKEVKEVEIIELPSSSKYKDYEVKTIKDKILKVNKKGIYKFRVFNSAIMKGRVCRIKIQRIPKSLETVNFNTGIKWTEKYDTTFTIKSETVITGYSSVDRQKSRKVLYSTDTNIVQVIDRVERVHSSSNANGNVSFVSFQLPVNTYYPNAFNPYKSTETVSWAYSIAVGESGSAWYKDANAKSAAKATSSLAIQAGLISSGYGALALFAIEGLSAFSTPPQGDNVNFRIYQGQAPTVYAGNSVAATGRITDSNQGYHSIRLENDNIMDGINVDVKVIAITISTEWKDEFYTVQESVPIKEQRTYKIPKVAMTKLPELIED